MKSDGLVSMIITCYNQENHILNTLKSVKNQTYINWECIVIDDGSTDKSAEVIKELSKVDARFIYYHQNNAGVSVARNNGFKLAKGEYIHFLDGDDTIFPEKLEKQIYHFEQNQYISVCVTDHRHYYEKTNEYKHYKFDVLESNPLKQLVYGWQNGVAFPLHAVLYKRNLWKENELPFATDYEGRSEDWIFNVMVALKGETYYYLDEILCNYHMTGNNYTSNIDSSVISAIHAAFYIHDKLPEEYQSDFIDFTIKKSMGRYLENKKSKILNDSGNWRLGNGLTKPFFVIINRLKKFF